MEEIIRLRTEHVKVDVSVLKDLLLLQAGTINEIKKKCDQRLNEDESKIRELFSKLTAVKETLIAETQILEHKANELTRHNAYLKDLEAEERKSLQEIKQLEAKQNILKSAKPNLQDLQILEQGKKKLKLYKDLTRIHWDYEATKHSIKGYVSNKRDYIHHFCYQNQMVNDELVNSLWHEIYLSTGECS